MSRKFTKNDFIDKSIIKHGNIYDYTLVDYNNARTKVRIICRKHGEFEQIPNKHILGSGCAKCFGESRRTDLETFISRSKNKHGNKYDYSKCEYINVLTEVLIICKEHGEFKQLTLVHYRSGCPKCGLNKRSSSRKNNKIELINKFNKKHSNKYDYSKVDYVKMREKVTIVCKKHNVEFLQTPEKHLSSKTGGCPKCNTIGKGKLTNIQFIEKSNSIHNNRYDYSKVEYIGSNKKVILICKNHGEFEITPNAHLSGVGCSKCSGNYKYKINDLLNIYNSIYENYKYDFKNYKNIKSKIVVRCPKHSTFETTAELLLNGYGCSSCCKKSLGEERISNYLIYRNIEYVKQKSFDGCVYKNKMQFDFYIPNLNLCIEYDGKQHFEPINYFGGLESFNKQLVKDSIKNEFCYKKNIKLIRIPYYEYDSIEKILDNEL
jgi:hypothetical protein